MDATITVDIKKFDVPEFVRVANDQMRKSAGLSPLGDIMLKDIPDATLVSLCDKFKVDVLKRAAEQRLASAGTNPPT